MPAMARSERFLERLRSFRWGYALWHAGIFVVCALAILFASVEVTSQPRFCNSCHIMNPYYQSWQHSAHHKIACVECHIPPGVTATVQKKWEALSMVTSYFTGTYGTKPWAQVVDASCFRCHATKDLTGTKVYHGVRFDHGAHLSVKRNGMVLRCTSCHSQTVQGKHMTVTASACVLCHFKNQVTGEGTARCTLCHLNPTKKVQVAGVVFDHAEAGRFQMKCAWCHAPSQGSTGEVPQERCVTCHNKTSDLAEYGNTALLHEKHVHEHSVDCTDCHLHFEHVTRGSPAGSAPRIASAASECRACHETGHDPQLDLFTGTGGRGVPPMPSIMFAAGVRCEGCHTITVGHGTGGGVSRASGASCVACHGPSYQRIFRNWKSGTEQRAAALAVQLDQTASAFGSPRGGEATLLADARYNLGLVRRGHGVHNVPYSNALLRKSHDFMNEARRAQGLAPLALPWHEPPYESPCLQCHSGIEDQKGTIFGRAYAHATHVADQKIECTACHRPHAEKPKGEIVRFGAEGCESCHHKAAVVAKPETCAPCHGGIKTGTVTSYRGAFSHALHIDDAEKTCADCHDLSTTPPTLKKEACKECHDT